MFKFNSLLFISILTFSCNSQQAGKTSEESETPKKVTYPAEINSKIGFFPLAGDELNVDKIFFADSSRNHKKHKLNPELVKFLSSKLSTDELSEPNAYYLKEYYVIEKAKKNKSYDKYVEKLDIGMTRDANCYALSRIEFGDSIAALLWRIDFSSYEACPYFKGSHFLLSTIYKGKVVQTIQLAANESAADAPVSSTIMQEARVFNTGKMTFKYESSVEEEGEQIEHVSKKKELVLSTEGFVKK
jgi:hypothetical protein